MKKGLAIIFTGIMVLSVMAVPGVAQTTAAGGESPGVSAADTLQEGSGNHSLSIPGRSYASAPSAAIPNQNGTASLHLDGEFGYASGGGTSIKPGSQMSIQMWVKHDGQSEDGATLIRKGNDGWHLRLLNTASNGGSDGEPKIEFDIGQYADLTSTKGVPEGEWTHVAAVYDGTRMSIYINGELAGSKSESDSVDNDGDEDVYIGTDAAAQSEFFSGRIDDIRIWNRGLSKGEVQSNYFEELSGDESGLMAYYPMQLDRSGLVDDAGGNDLTINAGITGETEKVSSPRDALPVAPHTHAIPGNESVTVNWTHRTGILGSENPANEYRIYRSTSPDSGWGQPVANVSGSTTEWTDDAATNGETYYYRVTLVDANGQESDLPKPAAARPYNDSGGGSLSLGGGSYATVDDRESLDLTDKSMTLEMWVKHDGESDGDATLIRKGGNVELTLLGSGEERPVKFNIGQYGNLKSTASGGVPAGEWTHVAATYNGNTMRILINGEIVATKDETGSISTNTRPLRIGSNDAEDGGFLSGNVDDVRVWDRALTPTTIRETMHKERIGDEPGLVGYWRFDALDASNATGSSTYKSTLEFKEGATMEAVGAFPTAPRTYARGDDTRVRVEWSNRTASADGYNLYRSTDPDGSDRQLVESFSGKTNAYVDTGLTNNETYYYEVTSVDADGQESDFSFAATAMPTGVANPAGNSLLFPANETAFANLSARPSLNIEDRSMTIQTWINFDADADENADILRLNGGNYHLRLAGTGSSRNIEFDIGQYGDLTTNTGLNAGQWYHVAAVYDGNEMSLYVDGELDNSKGEGGIVSASDSNLRLGTDSGENSNFFAGKLDEVMIWEKALSHDQVNNTIVSEKVGNENGLVAYWRGCNQGDSATTQGSAKRPMTLDLTRVQCSSDGAPLTDDTLDRPTASFTFSPSGPSVDESVLFNASASFDPDGTIESYEWDFGDYTGASGETASHAFPEGTEYAVTLTVTDEDGLTDSVIKTVSVGASGDENEVPSALASANLTSVETGQPIEFDGYDSLDRDGSITSYEWDFGDGTTGTGVETVHTYGSAGSYTVNLTVTDDDGATDSHRRTVNVTGTDTGDGGDGDELDFTIELQQEAVVTQGYNANISTYPRNEGRLAVSNATLELVVDQDGDGVFESSESVASRSVDYGFGELREEVLTYEDVQLAAGNYSYMARISKDGQSDRSFTNGTLTVESGTDTGDESGVPVSLSPTEQTVGTNATVTYDVVISNVTGGVGSADLSVSVNDTGVAEITGIDLNSGFTSSLSNTSIASDGSSVSVQAAGGDTADTGSVTVATVTVSGVANGTAALDLTVNTAGNESAVAYTIGTTTDGTVSVEEMTGATVIGSDPTTDGSGQYAGDGVHQDINGDGSVTLADVTGLFANYNSDAVQNNPDLFDFNGDGTITLADVTALFNQVTA